MREKTTVAVIGGGPGGYGRYSGGPTWGRRHTDWKRNSWGNLPGMSAAFLQRRRCCTVRNYIMSAKNASEWGCLYRYTT